MPKIIQLIQTHNGLIALCVDGSIWSCKITNSNAICHDWLCIHDVRKHFDDEPIEIKEQEFLTPTHQEIIEEYQTKLESYNISIENLEEILRTRSHFKNPIVEYFKINSQGVVTIVFFENKEEKTYTMTVDKLCLYLQQIKEKE